MTDLGGWLENCQINWNSVATREQEKTEKILFRCAGKITFVQKKKLSSGAEARRIGLAYAGTEVPAP